MKRGGRKILALGMVILILGMQEKFAGRPLQKTGLSDENRKMCEENGMIVQMKQHTKQPFSYPGCKVEQLTEEYIGISGAPEALENVWNDLEKRTDVVRVQPEYTYYAMDTASVKLPNDNRIQKQWAIYNDGSYVYQTDSGEEVQAVEGIDINAVTAWKNFQSQDEVVVAVIDTGVDYQHEDLEQVMWINEDEIPGNGIDDDHNGYKDDRYGWDFYNGDASVCSYSVHGKAKTTDNDNHGTHCAGTIAATADNGVGIAGVASNVNVKIMAIKALGGANGATTTSKLIKGIKYAMNNGADIINASWGGSIAAKDDAALKRVVERSGILFVAAAGNSGNKNDTVGCYPASYSGELDNVISVGSLDADGKLSHFSNSGTNVDILAPGSGILSTSVGGYATMSGTSMAAPMVTGVAAMLYAGQDFLYPAAIKEVLVSSYRELDTVDATKVAHPGIIDAAKALEKRTQLDRDFWEPEICELNADYAGVIKAAARDKGNAGVACLLYEKGIKGKGYFRRGARGTVVEGNMVKVSKSGTYTFYAKDNANNETIRRLYVKIDTNPPVVQAKRKGNRILLKVRDKETKVTKVCYAYGDWTRESLKSGNGKVRKPGKNGRITVKKRKKSLSVYAIDEAGNETFKIYRWE